MVNDAFPTFLQGSQTVLLFSVQFLTTPLPFLQGRHFKQNKDPLKK